MLKQMRTLFFVFAITLAIAFFWDHIPIIKETVGIVLTPTAGRLLNYDPSWGMVAISAIISLFITLIQKYTTDQETLRQIKKEQKRLQGEMKQFKENPEKLLEIQKKQLALAPQIMDISFRPLMFTSIPIILFFRWFNAYFVENPVKIFGFLHWILAYLLLSILFSSIYRKAFKVA